MIFNMSINRSNTTASHGKKFTRQTAYDTPDCGHVDACKNMFHNFHKVAGFDIIIAGYPWCLHKQVDSPASRSGQIEYGLINHREKQRRIFDIDFYPVNQSDNQDFFICK